MAALFSDVRRKTRGGVVLFWLASRAGSLPSRSRLRGATPGCSAAPACRATASPAQAARPGIGAGAIVAGAGVALRLTGYPPLPGWTGAVLARWEAWVLNAAAEALLQTAPGDPAVAAVAAQSVVSHRHAGAHLRDVHAMLALIEHGTMLGARVTRFTRLAPAERAAFLDSLEARGGLLAQASSASRDLCLLGYYGQPSTWSALGYEGPRVPLSSDPRGPGRTGVARLRVAGRPGRGQPARGAEPLGMTYDGTTTHSPTPTFPQHRPVAAPSRSSHIRSVRTASLASPTVPPRSPTSAAHRRRWPLEWAAHESAPKSIRKAQPEPRIRAIRARP